jgi:DNA end-binding protein Ku
MAPRTFWNGYLKLSLVTCAVEMSAATAPSERVRFHTLNRKTGHRVVSRYIDAGTGKPVRDADQIRGFPIGEDKYVMLDDEELDAVALETTHTLEIERFVPRDSVDLRYLERPHYLMPREPIAVEAYSVIRDAMASSGNAGLSRLVLYRRERPVMIEPRGTGMIVWTLRSGDEVRDVDAYFADTSDAAPPKDTLKLARELVTRRTVEWKDSLFRDRVQDALLDIIAARSKQKPKAKRKAPATEESEGKVVSIMDALRRSLANESRKRS